MPYYAQMNYFINLFPIIYFEYTKMKRTNVIKKHKSYVKSVYLHFKGTFYNYERLILNKTIFFSELKNTILFDKIIRMSQPFMYYMIFF